MWNSINRLANGKKPLQALLSAKISLLPPRSKQGRLPKRKQYPGYFRIAGKVYQAKGNASHIKSHHYQNTARSYPYSSIPIAKSNADSRQLQSTIDSIHPRIFPAQMRAVGSVEHRSNSHCVAHFGNRVGCRRIHVFPPRINASC